MVQLVVDEVAQVDVESGFPGPCLLGGISGSVDMSRYFFQRREIGHDFVKRGVALLCPALACFVGYAVDVGCAVAGPSFVAGHVFGLSAVDSRQQRVEVGYVAVVGSHDLADVAVGLVRRSLDYFGHRVFRSVVGIAEVVAQDSVHHACGRAAVFVDRHKVVA